MSLVSEEELQIIIEAYEEFLRQNRFYANQPIVFEGQRWFPQQLLNEMKIKSGVGLAFAQLIKERGLKYALTQAKSDIFETLAEKVERLEGRVLTAYITFPPTVVTPQQMAEEIRRKTPVGREYVKRILKTAIERGAAIA